MAPLTYVIRTNIPVEPSSDDSVTNYALKEEKLIERTPIDDEQGESMPTYRAHRAHVWELLSDLARDTDCWSYVLPAQCFRDGMMAYMGLYMYYLGENSVDNMSSGAERKLQQISYSGKKRHGYLRGLSRCMSTSMQSLKASSSTATLVLMFAPRYVI